MERLGAYGHAIAPLAGALALTIGIGGLVAAETAPAGAATNAPVVKLASKAGVGTILVNANGMTLYHYTPDSSTSATCTGACAQEWPPLLLAKGVKTAKGASGVSGLGTIRNANGKLQVTYKGQPLYVYKGDTSKTQASGQGVDGTWFVLSTSASSSSGSAGTNTSPTTSGSKSTPTTAAPSGGYGY
jgi:predicted lipoprotein with Yx(FWY)xxD motif